MATAGGTARRSVRRRGSWRPTRGDLGIAVLALPLAAIVAFSVLHALWIGIVGLVIIGLLFMVGIRDWRRSFVGLIVFLPYSGLLIIATYPATGPATLLKDLFFVLPAYAGFAGVFLLRGRSVAVPRFPLGLAAVFSVVVVLGLFLPTLPNVVVGLIGAKVWLMYIPLVYLAYQYVRTRADLNRLLTIMVAAAVIPCVVGVIEGVLVNTGHSNTVYSWYGNAAAAATQEFVNVGVGAATINRVPSTFSFVGQYSLFAVISLSVAYAWWRGVLNQRPGASWLGVAFLGLVALASLLSGSRGAVFAVPSMLVVMLVLDGVKLKTWILAPLVLALVFLLAASVFGIGVGTLLSDTFSHATFEFRIGTIDGVVHALNHTYVGLGTGVDTQSARYALPDADPFQLVGGRVEEAYWIKAMLELGLLGFFVLLTFTIAILRAVLRAHRQLRDPGLRSISAGLIALLAYCVFFNFKGSALDLDPMNVMFWVFVGILLRLPGLQEEEQPAVRSVARRRSASAAASGPGPAPAPDRSLAPV